MNGNFSIDSNTFKVNNNNLERSFSNSKEVILFT